MDKAREAAVYALERVRRDGAWTSAMADALKNKYELDNRSMSLALGITLGVLQNITLCDYYIDHFSKASSKVEPKVRDILRCAAYQILFMDKIPVSAAVNEAVSLCKKLGYSRAAGFCNAVLRKLGNTDKLPEIEGKDTADYLSIKYSHPRWLVEYIIERRGYDGAEAFFKANNGTPETALQVNALKIDADGLLKMLKNAGVSCAKHPWLPDCIIATGNIAAMPGFEDGLFYVQDPAAKCAALCAGLGEPARVLDACAAPGGKSFAAAIAMKDKGSIDSCDIHEKKIRTIRSGAQRLGLSSVNAFLRDAREPVTKEYDVIIADVPCSGYGVIRKKPEIRFKPQTDCAGLPPIQTAILENLSNAVRHGGVIVYSTCTVLKEENEDIVEAFLSKHSDFTAESFELPNGETVHDGYMTFWPDIHGTDGFFVCKLRRK